MLTMNVEWPENHRRSQVEDGPVQVVQSVDHYAVPPEYCSMQLFTNTHLYISTVDLAVRFFLH